MKRVAWMILTGIVIGSGICAWPENARSEAVSARMKPVEIRPLPDGVQVVLGFQGKGKSNDRWDEGALTYGEGWTQIQIPHAVIDPPKQSLRLDGGPLTEVFAYQFTPESVRVRLYHREPGIDGKGRVSLKPEAGGMVISVIDRIIPNRDPFASSAAKPAKVAKAATALPAQPAPSSAIQPIPVSDPAPELPTLVEGKAPPASSNPEADPSAEPAPETEGVSNVLSLPGRKEPSATPFAVGEGAPDLLSSSLKMVLALVLVLGLMGGCVYLFKRTVGRRMGLGGGKDRQIRVLSSAYLGPKKNIVLVEVAGETLVLGVSGDRINLLSRILPEVSEISDREEKTEPAMVGAPPETENDPRFERMLRSIGGDKVTLGDDLWTSKES